MGRTKQLFAVVLGLVSLWAVLAGTRRPILPARPATFTLDEIVARLAKLDCHDSGARVQAPDGREHADLTFLQAGRRGEYLAMLREAESSPNRDRVTAALARADGLRRGTVRVIRHPTREAAEAWAAGGPCLRWSHFTFSGPPELLEEIRRALW